MTHRQRVLRAFRFEPTDRLAFDLMEGSVWDELLDYFRARHGLQDVPAVLDFLDTDFRWVGMRYVGPELPSAKPPISSGERDHVTKSVTTGPLAHASTVAQVESHDWPDPAWWEPADYGEARRRWPDHALVFSAGWHPLFWHTCEAFGVEEALVKLVGQPRVFEAFVRGQHAFYMDLLRRGLAAACGHCDVCWLGDDFASQQSMLLSPDHWRSRIKPYLAEQVRLAREHDLLVLYHSCGAVRPVLGDLIDIGVNGLLVFQTTAAGMDAASIAREFGGRLAFYGGIDVQQLLSFGTPAQVQRTVEANARAFRRCGGYIVANSHHRVATIRGENIAAMCEAAKQAAGAG